MPASKLTHVNKRSQMTSHYHGLVHWRIYALLGLDELTLDIFMPSFKIIGICSTPDGTPQYKNTYILTGRTLCCFFAGWLWICQAYRQKKLPTHLSYPKMIQLISRLWYCLYIYIYIYIDIQMLISGGDSCSPFIGTVFNLNYGMMWAPGCYL